MEGGFSSRQALTDIEGRRSQLDRASGRVKDVRSSTDLSRGLCLINDLQQDLLQLTPLPDVPTDAAVVSFHPSPLLLTVSEATGLLGPW